MMTSGRDELQCGSSIEKKIFNQTALAKIELVPAAYAVWYAYYANSHPELRKEVDAVLSSGVMFDTTLHQELYNRYLRTETESLLVKDVQSQTEELIKHVFGEMLGANRTANRYGDQLEDFADKLAHARGLGEMAQIIKEMIQSTKSMAHSTRTLEKKLEAASKESQALRLKLHYTEEEAARDSLTGLKNRRAFDREMERLYRAFQCQGLGFSLLVLDIDFFKKFNDDYGHQVGDLVLQTMGALLTKGLKGGDFPARYGGEEFVVILPETSLEDATIVAEQLRIQISVKQTRVPETGKALPKITASIGVASLHAEDTIRSLVERADRALYLAKESGRNSVKTEQDL